MRTPAETAPTAWGTYLRQHRLQTRVARANLRRLWPMRQQAFARWLAEQAGVAFSWRAYIEWERGTHVPDAAMQEAIRNALAVAVLPKEEPK